MAEEKEKVIKLQECIDIITDYLEGNKEIQELNSFGAQMMIKGYIPLQQKAALAIQLLTEHQFSDMNSIELKMTELELNLFFKIIMEQYGSIDCSDKTLLTYENYDLLYPFFNNFILSYCKDDYCVFKELIKDTINMYNINSMLDALNSIDEMALQNATKSNEELINEINKNANLIKDLNNIISFNDPMTKKVVEEVKKIELNK